MDNNPDKSTNTDILTHESTDNTTTKQPWVPPTCKVLDVKSITCGGAGSGDEGFFDKTGS